MAYPSAPRVEWAPDGNRLLTCQAYAYPPNRVRVDYLSPQNKGPANVEILDTLWIETDRPAVALAFDAACRRIACLAADVQVEVVVVP